MLRPSPSRINISSTDVYDLKARLAKRPTTLQPAQGSDWFAVRAAHTAPSPGPPRWHKGVLRPGPARSRHDGPSSRQNHGQRRSSIATVSVSSSKCDKSASDNTQSLDQNVSVNTTPTDSAKLKRFSSYLIHEVDASRSHAPHLGSDDHSSILSLSDLLPPQASASLDRRFSGARSLDPLAPTFVPRIQYGSADEHGVPLRSTRPRNKQASPRLHVRPVSLANVNQRQPNPGLVQTTSRNQPRMSVHGHHSHRPSSSPGIVLDRYPVIHQTTSPCLFQTGSSSRSPHSHTPELRNAISPVIPGSTHRPHLRLQPPMWTKRRLSDRHISSIISHSVPNLNDTPMAGPMIHSRHSSLTWDRGLSHSTNTGAPVVTLRESKGGCAASRAPMRSHNLPSSHDGEMPPTFYLNHSPLDELAVGLRSLSVTSSSQESSEVVAASRTLHNSLLSGSLFYSDDLFGEEYPTIDRVDPSSGAINLAPQREEPQPCSANWPQLRHDHPTLTRFSQSSSPQSLNIPFHEPGINLPRCSSIYSNSSPLLVANTSTSHLSPSSSGPEYRRDGDHERPIRPLPGSPMPSVPSDHSLSWPHSAPPSTPNHSSAPAPPAFLSEQRRNPPVTPRFKVYDDDLPAAIQPQTPADFERRRSHHQPYLSLTPTGLRSTPSPRKDHSHRTYPATQPRPIFEPTTTELTKIPFLSPPHIARQTQRLLRRQRGNHTASDDRENGFDASAIVGLEDERLAWLRSRSQSMAGMTSMLDKTPPREGRYERMIRG